MDYTKAEPPSPSVGAWEGVLPLLLQDFMSTSASDQGCRGAGPQMKQRHNLNTQEGVADLRFRS